MSDPIREMIQSEIQQAIVDERKSLSALINTVQTTYTRVYSDDKSNPFPSDGPPDAEAMLRELGDLIKMPDVAWDISVIHHAKKRTEIRRVMARTEDHARELVRMQLAWMDEQPSIGQITRVW